MDIGIDKGKEIIAFKYSIKAISKAGSATPLHKLVTYEDIHEICESLKNQLISKFMPEDCGECKYGYSLQCAKDHSDYPNIPPYLCPLFEEL